MKILVVYDGTIQSKDLLRSTLRGVKNSGDRLTVLHVFNSAVFIDYDAGPKAEEIARREALGRIEEAREIIREAGIGIKARLVAREGIPKDEIIGYVEQESVDVLLCPQRYRSARKRFAEILSGKGGGEFDDLEGLTASPIESFGANDAKIRI
ncbi:MAG: universal stress protein [bacterium]